MRLPKKPRREGSDWVDMLVNLHFQDLDSEYGEIFLSYKAMLELAKRWPDRDRLAPDSEYHT